MRIFIFTCCSLAAHGREQQVAAIFMKTRTSFKFYTNRAQPYVVGSLKESKQKVEHLIDVFREESVTNLTDRQNDWFLGLLNPSVDITDEHRSIHLCIESTSKFQ